MGISHNVQNKYLIYSLSNGFQVGSSYAHQVSSAEFTCSNNHTTFRVRVQTKMARTVTWARGRSYYQSRTIGAWAAPKENFCGSTSARIRKIIQDRETSPRVPNPAQFDDGETLFPVDGTLLDYQRIQRNVPTRHFSRGSFANLG